MRNPVFTAKDLGGAKTEVEVTQEGLFPKTKGNKMIFALSLQTFKSKYRSWKGGTSVQIAFNTLNPDEREFLLTGLSIDQQKKIYGASNE